MDIKAIVKKYFPGIVELRNRLYNNAHHTRFKGKPIGEVFNEIYSKNHWNAQSPSGTGSDKDQTEEVKTIVAKAIREINAQTMLDIPCGDFNWMNDVDMNSCIYYGADIVEELINSNRNKYTSNTRNFLRLDLTTSDLPAVDLIFCRDCLVHLSYADIGKALINIKRSGSKYLLTTTFTGHSNRDIITGNWRPVNLEREPFTFPKPYRLYDEKCTEGGTRYADKSLALWKISDLPV